jgi:hypothetical protein
MLRVLLRDALRSLRHDARFVAVAVPILALTIGTAAAIYARSMASRCGRFRLPISDRLIVI